MDIQQKLPSDQQTENETGMDAQTNDQISQPHGQQTELENGLKEQTSIQLTQPHGTTFHGRLFL
jgi:hypothetical protein